MADTGDRESLLDSLPGIVDRLRAVHRQAVAAYTPIVDEILTTRSRDVEHIERTLDEILTFCGDDAALVLFKRLCRHYWDIDPSATVRHVDAYRDWFDSDDGTR